MKLLLVLLALTHASILPYYFDGTDDMNVVIVWFPYQFARTVSFNHSNKARNGFSNGQMENIIQTVRREDHTPL